MRKKHQEVSYPASEDLLAVIPEAKDARLVFRHLGPAYRTAWGQEWKRLRRAERARLAVMSPEERAEHQHESTSGKTVEVTLEALRDFNAAASAALRECLVRLDGWPCEYEDPVDELERCMAQVPAFELAQQAQALTEEEGFLSESSPPSAPET